LEAFAGTTGAEIIPPELLFQNLFAVDDPHSTLHLRFGRISPTTLAHRLEKNGCSSKYSWFMCRMAHLHLIESF
jgi:hypothetical protein